MLSCSHLTSLAGHDTEVVAGRVGLADGARTQFDALWRRPAAAATAVLLLLLTRSLPHLCKAERESSRAVWCEQQNNVEFGLIIDPIDRTCSCVVGLHNAELGD